MSPAHSLSEASSSLYQALGIPQTGAINCLAGTEIQSQDLHRLPQWRRRFINPIVKTLAVQEPNDEDQKSTIKASLLELAKKLVCCGPKKRHTNTLVFDGANFSDPVEYVHVLLARRF
jgi:hypothetical protein